ncbi:MAG: SDR family oxidoreductase [Chloroflexi bacterium]|nr:SDR family oxidoreductase [Chloroflexota bacterium]
MVLQDQVVFVTGASRGFGEAATLELVQRGHRVVATMRNPDRDGPALLAGAGAHSDRITVTSCDVTDRASVDAAVALAERTYGRVDAVFNNAGYGLYGPVEELQDEEVLREFDTNVVGQIRVVRAVLPGMRARGSGKIVNVSSLAGRISGPLLGLYAASKHAVEAMSEALRLEVAAAGVQVTIMEPGMFASDWQTTSLDVTQVVREGRSRMQPVVDKALAAFRERAASRPGSRAVAVALADIVELEQPLPTRWPVGDDAQQMIALRASLTDAQWEEAMRRNDGYRGVFLRAVDEAR